MKLTDKRFWKFEAMMLLCGLLLFVQLCIILTCNDAGFDSGTGIILILSFPAFIIYFAICGIPTWLSYKGNSWLKLAGYLYLISTLLIIVPLLVFLVDWNPATANMRPEDLPPDEGTFLTNNEFVFIISLIWAIIPIIPILIISYLTKLWVLKDEKSYKHL